MFTEQEQEALSKVKSNVKANLIREIVGTIWRDCRINTLPGMHDLLNFYSDERLRSPELGASSAKPLTFNILENLPTYAALIGMAERQDTGAIYLLALLKRLEAMEQ